MPGGVPVATVALNGAKNAGILAAQIVSTASVETRAAIIAYKQTLNEQVMQKSVNVKR
jgi:5-(carboxyamino)imidazole ribonucleotide mutase